MAAGFSHIRHIWISEPLEGSHDERTINLAYDKIEKVLLSFSIDLTAAKEGALDSSRPIKINGKTVPIADLPKDAYSLKVVEKSDIDVTDLVKYSANGTNNVFEVFYRGGKQGFGKGGNVGTLKLFLKIEVLPTRLRKLLQSWFPQKQNSACSVSGTYQMIPCVVLTAAKGSPAAALQVKQKNV